VGASKPCTPASMAASWPKRDDPGHQATCRPQAIPLDRPGGREPLSVCGHGGRSGRGLGAGPSKPSTSAARRMLRAAARPCRMWPFPPPAPSSTDRFLCRPGEGRLIRRSAPAGPSRPFGTTAPIDCASVAGIESQLASAAAPPPAAPIAGPANPRYGDKSPPRAPSGTNAPRTAGWAPPRQLAGQGAQAPTNLPRLDAALAPWRESLRRAVASGRPSRRVVVKPTNPWRCGDRR